MALSDAIFIVRKRISYALRGKWPKIEYKGHGMIRIKAKRRMYQYKPEYITGEPDGTEYYKC